MEWNNRAIIFTAGIYILLLFLLLLLGFTTKLPLPGEGGILINFGEDETGIGTIEPRKVEQEVKKIEAEQIKSLPKPVEQTNLTQDFEDAPAIKNVKPKQQTTVKPVETQKVQEQTKEVQKPVVDSKALYGKNTNSKYTGSEGVNGGTGNQGDPNGDVNSTNRSLGGGLGEGISFSLEGRSSLTLPQPEFNVQKEGKVVVQVTVDRSGKVVNAISGFKGSTTLDDYLCQAAKKAALASRFNNKEDAPQFQTGTITYVFRLR